MVEILLATYNGAQYLPAQLQSLLDQTDKDWTLLIRDDHSTDGTPAIIEQFAASYPGKVRVAHDYAEKSENDNLGGASQNFARLMKLSTGSYIMFCDQDDVWHPQKIARSIEKMREMERQYGVDAPLLVHTDFSIVDADNQIKLPSYNHGRKLHKDHTTVSRLLVDNVITGMATMINRPLAEKSQPIPAAAVIHDSWLGKVAALFGHIGYIDVPLANYRQHGNNVVGASTDTRSFVQRVSTKLKENSPKHILDDKTAYYHRVISESAKVAEKLRDRYGHEMRREDHEIIDALIALPGQSRLNRTISMIRHGLLPGNTRAAMEEALLG